MFKIALSDGDVPLYVISGKTLIFSSVLYYWIRGSESCWMYIDVSKDLTVYIVSVEE
jgi:hypothetical protein